MEKSACCLALFAMASAASAQGIPVVGGPLPMEDTLRSLAAIANEAKLAHEGIPVVDVEGHEAAAGSLAHTALLVGIQQQLFDINQALQTSIAAGAAPARVCKYADKGYSEGAVRRAGNVVLICIERSQGSGALSPARELVWQPNSPARLSAYLHAIEPRVQPK
jgi:uncharacterized protein DUF1496